MLILLGNELHINYQNRAYQREKVSYRYFLQQGILTTMLVDLFAGIPEVHIRVIEIIKWSFYI